MALTLAGGFVWWLLFVGVASDYAGDDWRWIGFHPLLPRLHVGQSQQQVAALLGGPQRRAVRHTPGYLFGRGTLDPSIAEEWTYNLPGWHGDILLDFDKNRKVIAVDWGYG